MIIIFQAFVHSKCYISMDLGTSARRTPAAHIAFADIQANTDPVATFTPLTMLCSFRV